MSIEIPDWVVHKAMQAAYDHDSCAEIEQHAMKAALSAALGAWVVPVGYASRKALATVSAPPFYGCDTYISAEEQTIVVCDQIYTLRQEKPE